MSFRFRFNKKQPPSQPINLEKNWFKRVFGDKAFIKACAKLFFPAIIEVIIVTSVNYFDSFFLAAFTPDSLGAAAKTATVIASQLIFVPTIMFISIASAGGIMAAQYYGKRDYLRFKECINFMLLSSLISNIIFITVFIVIPLEIVGLMSGAEIVDTTDPLAVKNFQITNQLAATYLRYQSLTLIPYLFTFIMAVAYRQDNSPIIPMIATVLAVITNIILDPILIIYVAKNANEAVMYVALATVIARALAALFLLTITLIRKDKPYYFFNHIKIRKDIVKAIFINGWQIFINEILFAVGTVILATFFLRYNQTHRDAIATVNLIVQFTTLIWPGAATVVAVLVLAKLGANKIDEAKNNTKKLMSWSIVVGIVLAIILLILSFFVNEVLNPPAANSKEAILKAEQTVVIAKYLEWIVASTILLQAPSAVIYFCVRGGGSKWLLCIDTLTIVIWIIFIGTITNVNISANLDERIHPVLLFFMIESQYIFKIIASILIWKYTKWANNLANKDSKKEKGVNHVQI
ncbi:MATE family efflux transporter [Ureaplasma diversum]|uniref:MATE family efflux transporter n=1 Tax=Ureaplasma diversum TaxID=42094 RepID=UPI000AB422E6|nr:MATE family efflux transporter [Ureaplasma diversum]